MKFKSKNFSFCSNIFPGESWKEIYLKIRTYYGDIRKSISILKDGNKFGLGLRLSFKASEQLKQKDNLLEFKSYLKSNNFYVFTINAFPFGTFHKTRIKENVYFPDWSSEKRVRFIKNVIEILRALLPEGEEGSISTVPVCYGKEEAKNSIAHLLEIEDFLAKLYKRYGKKITLGLEPEPDCFLENTSDSISFFRKLRRIYGQELNFLGICFDTCHFALQYEDLKEAFISFQQEGIIISKVQLSSALSFYPRNREDRQALKIFDDGVYLHQTRVHLENGGYRKFADLPLALRSEEELLGEWRVHCHLPLGAFKDKKKIKSTCHLLTKDFLDYIWTYCPHFEIETYTYFVLPNFKEEDLVKNIAKEFSFVASVFSL